MPDGYEQQIPIDESRPGHQFADTFQVDIDTRNSSIRSRDQEVINRHRMTMEEWFSIYDAGFEPATIVNLHSRPLEHNFGFMGILRIPERRQSEAYRLHVVKDPRIDQRDLGDAKFAPKAYTPYQLAKDFCGQFKEMGGVFCYLGERAPKKEEIEKALEQMVTWYRKIYRAAQNQWARKPTPYMIDDHMRSAARMLFEMGEIGELPVWVEKTKTETRKKWLTCAQCGKDDIPATAKICTMCQYVFDEEFYTSRGFTVSGGIITGRPGEAQASKPVVMTAPVAAATAEKPTSDEFAFHEDSTDDLTKVSDAPLKNAPKEKPHK